MGSLFGMNAGSVYAAQQPGMAAGMASSAQNVGIQAGAQEEQAGNEMQVAGYNSGLAALEGHLTRENQAEDYNASGVLLQGSPLAQLEQTRQLASAQVSQIQNQGLMQAQLEDTNANQTINSGRAAMLGTMNQELQGQENANIEQENVGANDLNEIGNNVEKGLQLAAMQGP
jgi:hypothetical protein